MKRIKNKLRTRLIVIIAILVIGLLGWQINVFYKHKAKTIHNEELLLEVLTEGEQITIGAEDATHTLVLFYDYSCNFCRHFFEVTLYELKPLIENNELQLILKPVNLSGDKTRSEAYQLLYCLNRFDLFQELHEVLLLEPDFMYQPDYSHFINDLMLENEDINSCINNSSTLDQVTSNKRLLGQLGFHALPLFLYKNKAYNGNLSTEKIKLIINE